MVELIKSIIDSLTLYFAYIYPGIITIFIYGFVRGRSIVENKITLIKGITISYVYVIIMNLLLNRQVSEYSIFEHFLLILVSFVVPIIWNAIVKSKIFRNVLHWLKIDTEICDNLLDLIKSKEHDPKKGIALKVFLDKQELMYEGKLREHEADINKSQIICLSGYRRYIKKNDAFEVKNDYSGDNSRWVALKSEDITRIEIKFGEEK